MSRIIIAAGMKQTRMIHQIFDVLLLFFDINIIHIIKHGKPKADNNPQIRFITDFIAIAVIGYFIEYKT